MENSNKKQVIYKITTFLFAMLLTYGISYLKIEKPFFEAGRSVLCVVFLILFYFLLDKTRQLPEKKYKIGAAILAILFAILEVIGYSINQNDTLSVLYQSKGALAKTILDIFTYGTLFYIAIAFLFHKIATFKIASDTENSFFRKKKGFFIIWGILFACWLPYFLQYFPGIFSSDSIDQMLQGLGAYQINNHHPVFHTFLISIAMKIGVAFGSQTIGVAIYAVVQMAIMSGIFSFLIYYMANKKINTKFLIALLIFFAIYPIFPQYSITMWKDVPFGLSILVFTIFIFEFITNKEKLMNSKMKLMGFIFSAIMVILFKNNGIYIVLPTLLVILFLGRKYWKKILILIGIIIAIYSITFGILFKILNISSSTASREMLSIPMQQIARVYRDREQELTEEEKAEIYRYLKMENIGQSYDPHLSDPIKDHFAIQEFQEDKVGFLKIWFQMVIKYPMVCIEATLANSIGYWYPETTGSIITENNSHYSELGLNIQGKEVPPESGVRNMLLSSERSRNIPIFGMLFSIGFQFWISWFFLVFCICHKKYQYLTIFIPTIILWATCMASPVYCEYRYAFGILVSLPVILLMGMLAKEEKENE